MHEATPFFIILILLIVTFFMALIIPKGKRKLLWLFVWFVIFFADLVVFNLANRYYISKYAGIEIYKKSLQRGYYVGEIEGNTTNFYVGEKGILSIVNNFVDFVDFKEKNEHTKDNKFYRIYLDNNISKDCFLSKNNIGEFPITYFLNHIHSKLMNKCIAKKEITKNEVTDISFVDCNSAKCQKMEQPKISFLGRLIGIKFDYEAMLRSADEIVAVSKNSYCIYKDSSVNSWLLKMLSFEFHAYDDSLFAKYCQSADIRIEGVGNSCDIELIKRYFQK
ncbi:hypothetical protein [Campylobacter sp. RM16191]|uniref:hypothetical protein n=1 Tax=Campylobacter sp. RM16191 TaxID=1705728 RepID=UPI0014762C7B|nr:hypothetical protein [Campylobacter sp. RM16191]